MRQITFQEAQQLINAGEAGYYCIEGRDLRSHPDRTCIFINGTWFLAEREEFHLDDRGITGDENAWGRAIMLRDNQCESL